MLSFGSNVSPILWCMYRQYPTNSTISVFVFGCLHRVCRPYHRLLAKIETDPEAKRPPPLGCKNLEEFFMVCGPYLKRLFGSTWLYVSTSNGSLIK